MSIYIFIIKENVLVIEIFFYKDLIKFNIC